jgi:hypothetical protein
LKGTSQPEPSQPTKEEAITSGFGHYIKQKATENKKCVTEKGRKSIEFTI